MINLAALSIGSNLLVHSKEIGDLNVESSGEFHDCGQRGATFTAQNLREVSFREVGLQVKAVQRAVFLNHDLA